MPDKNIYWSKTLLTGGTAPALDSIDGTGLQDGEVAHVWVSGVLYIYLLDVDSAAAEASPTIIAPDTNAGDKRWILQGVRTVNVGSDADGDMYYRASGVLARLAKGTARQALGMNSGATAPEWIASLASLLAVQGDIPYAGSANTPAALAKGAANTKLFMNAGATAPEWAAGIKVIYANYDSATKTGSWAITGVGFKPSWCVILADISGVTEAIGFTDGTISGAVYNNNLLTEQPWYLNTGAGQTYSTFTSWDADGVTWSITKTLSPTGTAYFYFLFGR